MEKLTQLENWTKILELDLMLLDMEAQVGYMDFPEIEICD